MDQEIKDILKEAHSRGASPEQLQKIADAYFESKKKNQGVSGLKEPGAKTASTGSQSLLGGVGPSTRPTLAAAAGKPEVQTPSESVRSGLKPTAARQLETGVGIRGATQAEKDAISFKRQQNEAAAQGIIAVPKSEAGNRQAESFANTGEFIALRGAEMGMGIVNYLNQAVDASVGVITAGYVRPNFSKGSGEIIDAINEEKRNLNSRILGEDVASKGISELVIEGNVSGAAQKAALETVGVALDMAISRKISTPFMQVSKPAMSVPQTLSFSKGQFLADASKKAFREGLAMTPLALKAGGYKIADIEREQAQSDVFDDLKTLGVGTVIGGIEMASEALFRTSVDDLLLNGFSKNFVSNLYKANKPVREAILGTSKEVLTQSGQEGVEEIAAELADIVIDGTLYGKDMLTEANAFALIDSFILGSLVAGPTTLLSYGPSSIGKASDIASRRKVIDALNASYDKLSDENLSPLEKMEIKKGIETKLGMLAGIQKQDNDFYELFSEEDKMEALRANQKITMGQVLLSKIEDPDARFNIEQGLKKAYSEKTKVESKYDPNIKVYEYVGQEGKPVPSAEQTGEAAVQAQPVQEAGTRTPETDRIFQALGQDETLGAMERGEEVYEDDAVAAQERILGLIDQVNSLNLPQEVKDQYIEVLGEKFEDLEYYDNKTTVSIEESTERRPVGAPKRVIRQKVGERASTGFPRLRNYERLNNSQVTIGTEAEGEVSVIEEQEDGTVALVSYKDGVKATSRPLANSLLDLEYVESVFDNDGTLTGVVMRPKTAKGQPESTEAFTISNKPELAMDIAIQAKTEQVGSVAQAEFEYAFEEVTTKKVVKKKMPVQERPVKPAKPEPVVKKKEVNAPIKQDLNSLIESDPARAEVYAAMLTSMDLLKSYYPDARFVLTENDAETNEYLTENDPGYDGGNVDGQFFQNKNTGKIEILVNKQRARTPEVVFHEVFHAGFAKVYGQNVEKAKEFMQSLKKILNTGNAQERDIAKKIDDFLTSRRYTEEESPEEYLAEGSGILAANKAKLSAGMVNKLKNFFNRIATTLKMKPIFKEAATTAEVVNFLNGFVNAANASIKISVDANAVSMETGTGPLINKPIEISSEDIDSKSARADYDVKGTSFENVPKVDVDKLFADFEKENGRPPRVWIWMSDQLKRGTYYNPETGVTTELGGGQGFATDPENVKRNAVWASGLSVPTLVSRIEDSDFIWFMIGSPNTSFNFSKGTMAVVEKEILNGLSKLSGQTINGIKVPKNPTFETFADIAVKYLEGPKELPQKWEIVSNILKSTTARKGIVNFGGRKLLIENLIHSGGTKITIPIQKFLHEDLGVPTSDKLANLLREEFLVKNDIKNGEMGLVIKPTGVAENANSHDTYMHDILGSVVGLPTKIYNVIDIVSGEAKKQMSEKIGKDVESLSAPAKIKTLVGDVGTIYESDKLDVKSKSSQAEKRPDFIYMVFHKYAEDGYSAEYVPSINPDDFQKRFPLAYEVLKRNAPTTYRNIKIKLGDVAVLISYVHRNFSTAENIDKNIESLIELENLYELLSKYDERSDRYYPKEELIARVKATRYYNKDQKKVILEFVDKINSQKFFGLVKPAKGGGFDNYYSFAINQLASKDPRAFVHEVGHWGFFNLLSPQDRVNYYKYFYNRFKDDTSNDKRASELYIGKPILFTNELGNVYKAVSNALDGPQEYFAVQFEQWYFNSAKYENTLVKLFKIIDNYARAIIRKFSETGFNPDLVANFEKIVTVKSKSSKAPAKNIGGEKYFHHSYLDAHIEQNDGTLTYENVTRAEQAVKKALREAGVTIKFNTFKYNPSTKVLTFQEGRGFDTMREPVVGHSIGVNLSTGKVVSGFKSDGSLRAPSEAIWHNKWQWVDDTYTGFDVEAAKAWSEEWGSKFATGERRDIGKKENWDNKLREKGLPVEGTAVMSRSRLDPELVAPNVQIVKNPYTGVEHTIELPMSSGGTSIPQKNHVVTDFIKNSKKSPQKPEDIKRFASIGAGKKTFNGKASPSHEMMRDRMPNAEIYLLDPENISPEENLAELDKLFSRPADAAEAANVLNVIPDKAMRNNVIQSVYDVLDEGGWAYFKIFVGSKQNKTLGQVYKEGTLAYGDNKELNEELYKQNKEQGIADDSFYYSRQTGKDKMQVNQRAPFYQPEVEAVFGDKGFVDNDIIVVQKTTEVKSRSRADFSVAERFETADIKELANYKSGRIYSTKWTGSAKAAESIEKKLLNEGFDVNVRVASTNSRYVEFYRESDQKEGVIRVSGHGRIGDITLETRTREAVGKTGKPYEFKEVFFTVNSNIDFADDFFEANVMTSKSFEATKEALDSFVSAPKSKSSREWVDNVQLEVRAKLQDRMARILKIQEDIQSYIGGTVPLNFDFKNAEARLPGVVKDLQDKTMDKVEEIVKTFSDAGLDIEQFNDLLYALHAQERNNAVRIRTTDIPMSLKTLRKMFDLTPTEAAKNAGLPVDVYKSIEANGNATEQELSDIVGSYGMTMDEFYRDFARNNEGSGMSDLEARDILSNYGVKNLDKPLASMLPAKLAKAVSMSHEINQQTRDLLVSSGLETREIVDAYEYAYDNYVPLRGFVPEEDGDEVEVFIEGGRRLPVRGKIKRAMGRYSKSDDPFTQLIAQNFNVIARAKKNETMQKLYNLTDDVKNPEVYKAVDTSRDVKYKEQFVNGKQVRVPVSSRTYSNDPRYVSVRFNGIDRFIKFEDPRMVEALNGMNIQQTNAIFSVFKTINRAMTATITVYDPEFVLRNFSRDIQMSLINVMAEQELVDGLAVGENIVVNTMKGVPKSFKAIFDAQRGNENNTKYAQYYKDFLEDGGQIETFYGGTSKEVGESVQNLFDKENRDSSGRLVRLKESTMKASFGLIKDINSSVENAIRLSAYIAAREAGVSREKAAELGKKVTVDFNRTGEYGQFMNSLYLFFNASIQGSSRLIRTLKPIKVDGKLVVTRPQKIAIGLVAFGAILSLINAAISGDDEEDGKSWYSKIPDYEKERNMIFMNPFDKQGKDYFKVPLPYGLNIFYVLGNSIADVSLGENKLAEAFTNVALSIVSNFSPIGFPTSESPEKRLLKMITPSVFQPIAGIALNEDFTGRPVYSENLPFDKTPLPDSELGKKAGPVATNLAKTLNEVTGGSSVRPGSTDVNPDVLEYILNYYTGGVGKTSSRVGKLAYAGIKGELKDVKPNDVPLARVFYGTAYDRIDYAGFYKKISNVYQLNEEIKLGRRSDSEANRIKITLAEAKAVDKRLRDIRKKEKEGKIQEDRAEDLRNAIMKNFLRDYDKRKIDDI